MKLLRSSFCGVMLTLSLVGGLVPVHAAQVTADGTIITLPAVTGIADSVSATTIPQRVITLPDVTSIHDEVSADTLPPRIITFPDVVSIHDPVSAGTLPQRVITLPDVNAITDSVPTDSTPTHSAEGSSETSVIPAPTPQASIPVTPQPGKTNQQPQGEHQQTQHASAGQHQPVTRPLEKHTSQAAQSQQHQGHATTQNSQVHLPSLAESHPGQGAPAHHTNKPTVTSYQMSRPNQVVKQSAATATAQPATTVILPLKSHYVKNSRRLYFTNGRKGDRVQVRNHKHQAVVHFTVQHRGKFSIRLNRHQAQRLSCGKTFTVDVQIKGHRVMYHQQHQIKSALIAR